jgi:prephenate dehydrogenase
VDVAVIGLGLIGGSMLRALAAAGHRVYGYDADPSTRATARTAAARVTVGTRWRVTGAAADAVSQAQLVVVAVPLPAVAGVFDELAAVGFTGLVTDVVSVKGAVLDLVTTRLRGGHGRLAGYVGGHPMAGGERSGFEATDHELFLGAPWVLCLEPDTHLGDWLELAALIVGLGARVVPATADEHDRAVAAVSHVPHLFATALVAGVGDDPLALTLGAGSFRDGTRVAASQPGLVAAMCGGNAEAVLDALDASMAALADARGALAGGDPIADLRPWFAAACAVRLHWPPGPGSSIELPAQADTLLRLGRIGGWITAVAKDRTTVTAVRPATPARPGPGGSPAGR